MPVFDDIFKIIPGETQDRLKKIWGAMSDAQRGYLKDLFNSFPLDSKLTPTLVNLAVVHFRQAFGAKSKVAIVGPANVGKSTLYNRLIRSKDDKAAVSPLPGTTRVNQAADAGLFTIVDTPGADAVGEVGETEKQQALDAARDADFLVIMFDAIQGIKRTEQELFKELCELEKPFIVVLNKVDLVRKHVEPVVSLTAKNLGLTPDQVIPVTAKDGKNLDKVLLAVVVAEPELVAALGSALPEYRWTLAWRTIGSSASIAAVIALTPLPVLDFGPLVILQTTMVLGIARIYNYKITLARAKELIATFGLAYLGRTLFQELSKFGGIPGWFLAAAIASSMTVVMGFTAARWFENGEKISLETFNQSTRKLTQFLLEKMKRLGKAKPEKDELREFMLEALEDPAVARLGPEQPGSAPETSLENPIKE